MKKILLLSFYLLCLTVATKAQFLDPPKQQIKDSLPQHPHPDSMYAKTVVLAVVSPFEETTYTVEKVICEGCDSSRVEYLKRESLRVAKQQKGLKTFKNDYGLETGVKYTLPFKFTLPRNGPYPK